MDEARPTPVGRAAAITYGLGSFGTGVFSTVPTVLLLYYCTESLALGAAIAGGILLAPKLWAIVWDLVVGRFSDRVRSPFGRRRPFILTGAVALAVMFVLLFHAPALTPFATTAYVALAYFGLVTAYSLFAVPYTAVPADLSDDPATMRIMISWRMAFVLVGVLGGAAAAPWLVAANGGGRQGYAAMSLWIAAACLAFTLAPLAMLHGRDRPAGGATAHAPSSPLAIARAALRHPPLRRLIEAFLALAVAFGAFSALVPYLVTKGWGRPEGDIGTALGCYLLAAIVAVPLWTTAGRALGEDRALRLSATLYAAGVVLIAAACLAGLSWPWSLALFAVGGVPFAGLQVVPFGMASAVIHSATADSIGSYTGVWTATEKLGLAIGPAVAAGAVSLVGRDNGAGLSVAAILIVVVLCGAAMAMLAR